MLTATPTPTQKPPLADLTIGKGLHGVTKVSWRSWPGGIYQSSA